MLIASLSLGDTLITLVRVSPLTAEREEFDLTFTDLPTRKSVTVTLLGENDAMHALAAWIISDTPLVRVFPQYQILRESLGDDAHLFLP